MENAMSHIETTIPGPISPICVSPGGGHFVDAAGRPVFWLGDTQWELFRLYTPDGARRVLSAAALTYVASTAMAAMQLLRMFLLRQSRD